MPFGSKYRHVYGEVPKSEFQYLDITKPYTSGEGRYAASNPLYFAVSKQGGGGPLYVVNLDKPGRQDSNMPTVNVHKGKCLDFDFHPFINNLLGSVSEDTTVCVTQIPDGGLTKNISSPELVMKGHMKKTHLMKWHPTANNILATASWDKTVKLWNVENGENIETYEGSSSPAFSIEWNNDGSLLACTNKDKECRIFDPRTNDEADKFQCMRGTKSSKLFWVPTYNWIGATGFNKQAKRMVRIWDLKNTAEPRYEWVVDQQSSVLMPHYDPDTHLLFLAGKGDGSVFFNELVNDKKTLYSLGVYRDTEPQKGGCFLPKRALDTQKCEVARFMKLTRSAVVPISFIVPRKTGKDIFQGDIFPDCASGIPSLSADEYLGGKNAEPLTMSMDPDKRTDDASSGIKFEKKKTYQELSEENNELKQRIEELEKQLAEISGGE